LPLLSKPGCEPVWTRPVWWTAADAELMDKPPIKTAANVAAMVLLQSFMVYLLNLVSVGLVIISLESVTVRVATD
jgi:hypothetical protein